MKILLRIAIAVFVLVIAAVLVALLMLDSTARRLVESEGSKAVGVAVTLDSISIKPLAGKATINGLAVANPAGYRAKEILLLGHGDLEVKLGSLLSEQPEISKIDLDGVSVNIEQKVGGSNLKDLLAGMESASKPSDSAGASSSGQQRFKVEVLSIRDIKVVAQILPVGGGSTDLSFTIDEIEVENLDEQNASGLLLDDVIGKVIGAILAAVVEQLAIKAPGELIAGLGNAIDSLDLPGATVKIGDTVVGVGEGVGGVIEGAGQAVEEGLEGIGKGVGGLFGGNKQD